MHLWHRRFLPISSMNHSKLVCHLSATSGSSKATKWQEASKSKDPVGSKWPQRFEARAQESPQVQAQFVRAVCMATCQLHRHMGFISQVSCLGHSNLCGSCLGFELVSLCQGSKAAIFVLNPAELLIDILSYPNRQWWHHVGKLRPGQWGKVGQPLQAVSLPKQDGWTWWKM